MAVEFSQNAIQELNDILTRYPTKRAATLPALHIAQREFGYISDETVEYIAGLLELSPADVTDTLTFYTMYFRKPIGRNLIQVCHTLSCSILGAGHIVNYISDKIGIRPGETTEDGKYTLIKVECLGSCGTAPVVRVNDDYHEDMTEEKIDKLLESLK